MKLGQKYVKNLVGFLGDLKAPKFHSEINWPLKGKLKFKILGGSDQNWSCPDFALLAVSAKLRQCFKNWSLNLPKNVGQTAYSWIQRYALS